MSNNLALNIEDIKKEKDGLDVLADIYIHAVLGERLSEKNLLRLQWFGIYAEDEFQETFQIKIPLNMGELNLDQLKILTFISKEFANNSLTFSSEQKVEFKDIKLHNIPEILKLLNDISLSTLFESGHTVRRVATCPLNGIDADQLIDVSDIVKQLDNLFIGNKKYSNLPSKLQFAVSGYEEGCALNYIPDVAFNASKDNKGKVIFKINIFSNEIGYIFPSQVLNTAKTIANIYRDFGSRKSLENSFTHFVLEMGIPKFIDILESSLSFSIKAILFNDIKKSKKPRMGINDSKIENQSYIGCRIENLKIDSSNLDTLTSLLEKHSASRIKITHKGNLIILDAPTTNVNDFAKDLQKISFNPFA